MAGSSDDAEKKNVDVDPHSDEDDEDSACGSSDVTWGANDFETSDVWASYFDSDATNPDDLEPLYDLDR
jgi:hypothetical protein